MKTKVFRISFVVHCKSFQQYFGISIIDLSKVKVKMTSCFYIINISIFKMSVKENISDLFEKLYNLYFDILILSLLVKSN